MQQALKILEENSIEIAIQKFERQKIENEGAKVLLIGINEIYQLQRERVCKWIVSIEYIQLEYKFQAYNILGCTLEEEDNKILHFENALRIGLKQKFDISDPLINLQKVYLQQQQYDNVIKLAYKYQNYLQGRYKVVELNIVAKAYFGLNQIDTCEEYSKKAFEECKMLYGMNDPMTLRMFEYLNILQNNVGLNQSQQILNQQDQKRQQLQSRQLEMSIDLGKTFTQFEFIDLKNNIQRENSNTQEIRVEFSQKNRKTNTLYNQNLCCKLIKEFFGFADITIIINNIKQNQETLYQEYKEICQEIDNGNEESLDQISQFQIKSDEGSNNNKYIYQLQVQNENNISQLDKMIYIQNAFILSFIIESAQQDITFYLDGNLFQYQISSGSKQRHNETSDFFYRFKNTLDNVVILTFRCQSEMEAIRIKNILNQKKIYKNITKQLNVEDLNIILSSDINLNDFHLYTNLQKQAQQLKQQTNQIILICKLVQSINIGQLQKYFNELAQKSSDLIQVKEQFQIELAFNPDANVIDQKIKQLQQKEEQFDISVSQPQIKLGNKKMFIIDSIIEYWMDSKNQQMDEMKQIVTKLKEKIFEIYFPSLNIILNDPQQVKLWQQFLQQFHPNNPKENYTINTQLVIELKGETNIINDKYEQIQIDLKQFQYKRFNFQIQEKIAQIFVEEQNFEGLFKSSLEQISQQYGICLIQIFGVNNKKIIVDVYIDDQTKLNNIQKCLQEEFFEELNIHIEKNFEIEDLYNCLGMPKQQFKDEYQVEVPKIDKEQYFICQNIQLDKIKKIIEKSKEDKKQNRKTQSIECLNILVFNELKEKYLQQSSNISEQIHINFPLPQKIILQAMNQEQLTEQANKIKSDIQKLENQLINKTCVFQEKQAKFFKKNFKQYYPNLESERKASIKFETTKYSLISQVQSQDKKVYLVQGDITLLQCDAIVNFHCSQQNLGLSLLTEKILDYGGQQYSQQFYDLLTQSTPAQNEFDISIYELSSFQNINYIVDAVIPYQSKIDFNNPQSINQIINALFNKIQNQYEITRLSIPILNICGEDKQQIETYLNAIIDRLFNYEHPVKQIYICEINDKRIKLLESVLLQVSNAPLQSKQKFQWQWKHTIKFVNYNEDINKQINDAYDRFLKQNQEIIVDLKFQIQNKPSTHFVDLKTLKIKELENNSEQQIIYQKQKWKITYLINNQELDKELTKYFINMYKKKCFQFEIFWKDMAVVINNEGCYQLNKRTQYKRTIQKIPCQQQVSKQRITYEFNMNSIQEQQNQILIQSFDSNLNNIILNEIIQKLQESQISFQIDIPQFSNLQLQKLIEYLQTVTQRIKGRIIPGQSINIEIFKNKVNYVNQQLDLIKSYAKKEYPKEWIAQDENYIKVLLDENSQEYIDIQKLFQQTEKGTIKAIFRIQNLILWDNYISERNKLFDVCDKQQRQLLPQERQRYLWHGVRSQHPSVIYKSITEAFDVSYSNAGYWGSGIYFAENASYSRDYSYTIQPQDDPQYAGNLVFLCCLVTTGKLEEKQKSSEIKKPSDGYDCVTGFTKGSNVFIIYQMHVRRAYPAYEVIYQ